MNIEQAVDTIYNGLVSESSIPVRLRSHMELDLKQLDSVQKALDYAIEYYKEESFIPKKVALALFDVYGAFSFKEGCFDDDFLVKLEDIGLELQEKALELFSED